jgi:hypothetical protein
MHSDHLENIMRAKSNDTSRSLPWGEREIDVAAGEAARIGRSRRR